MTARLLHIGVHESLNRNAGDTLLFPLTRACLDRAGPFSWVLRQLWEPLAPVDAGALAGNFDGVVIGGGGLLLRDQAGADASASGWQWNAPVEAVRALTIPLVVFGIGYNRFRGQSDFDPPFAEHLRATVERSVFFGLRNSGSIRAVRSYLPADLHDRIEFQPCPTTVMWELDERVAAAAVSRPTPASPVLALNVAFDRADMRYGSRKDQVLGVVAREIARAADRGWEVRYVAHKTMDLEFVSHLAEAGVNPVVVDTSQQGPGAVVSAYADCDLAVGARGHAQMIPFGLRKPIVSLVSHDKMAWFLEDVGHPEWGVELDNDLDLRLGEAISAVEDSGDRIAADVVAAQQRFWHITTRNLEHIADALAAHGNEGGQHAH